MAIICRRLCPASSMRGSGTWPRRGGSPRRRGPSDDRGARALQCTVDVSRRPERAVAVRSWRHHPDRQSAGARVQRRRGPSAHDRTAKQCQPRRPWPIPPNVPRRWRAPGKRPTRRFANRADMLRRAGAFNAAYEAYQCRTDGGSRRRQCAAWPGRERGWGRTAGRCPRILEEAARPPRRATRPTLVALSRLHAATGAVIRRSRAGGARRRGAAVPRPRCSRATRVVYSNLGDAEQLSPIVDALSRDATRPSAH